MSQSGPLRGVQMLRSGPRRGILDVTVWSAERCSDGASSATRMAFSCNVTNLNFAGP